MPPGTRSVLAAALVLCAGEAPAQDLDAGEAATLPRLIASGCFDIHDSTGCETVILLESAEEADTADLVILTDRRTEPPAAPLLVVRSVAFNGAMWGMAPSLEQAPNGSLLLHSEQTGIGRYPWTQTLTLAFREGEFLVAGFSYSTYDRALGHNFGCDLNLLTGRYEATLVRVTDPDAGTEEATDLGGRTAPERVAVRAWDAFRPLPAPCAEAMDGFYDE